MTRHLPVARTVRRHRRVQVRFHAVESPDDCRTGFTEDVTEDGLFIQSRVLLPPRTRIVIELDVDGESVRVTGQVIWAKRAPVGLAGNKRHGMGVRLDENCGILVDLVVGR